MTTTAQANVKAANALAAHAEAILDLQYTLDRLGAAEESSDGIAVYVSAGPSGPVLVLPNGQGYPVALDPADAWLKATRKLVANALRRAKVQYEMAVVDLSPRPVVDLGDLDDDLAATPR